MSADPITYDGKTHPSLCSSCISRQEGLTILSGYCLRDCRCDGCGYRRDLAMCVISKPLVKPEPSSRTGTQNRPYPADALMVRATLTVRGIPDTWEFNWNDRESVRRFAADSDRCIRAGGTSHLERVPKQEPCPDCHGRGIEDAHALGDGLGGSCRTCGGKGMVP